MKVKVAVLQYDVPEDSDASFKKLDEMVLQASWAGAKLVVAPETAVGEVGELKETKCFSFDQLLHKKRRQVLQPRSHHFS